MEDSNDLNGDQLVSTSQGKANELLVWQTITGALQSLDSEAQARVLRSVTTLLEIDLGIKNTFSNIQNTESTRPGKGNMSFSGSEDRVLTPKEFLHQKRPSTDIDKIACLAYYLTHYRNTPHFKTLELSQLNTEAAQIKFSNAAQSVENASKAGLLVPALKGTRQLSAVGEIYVGELPDKVAARTAIDGYKRRRNKRGTSNSKSVDSKNE